MQLNYQKALELLQSSKIIFSRDKLYSRIKIMAELIEADIKDEIPVFLNVMNGGMFFGAELLKNISKPLISDYIHASRYGDMTFGSTHIAWFRQPKVEDIKGKIVYVIDDILDEGHTLAEIQRFLLNAGAKECKMVVLIDKDIGKPKPVSANYIGFSAPNHFLFGFGMDIYGLYRQLPDIYAYNI